MPPFLPLLEHSPPSSDFRRLPFLLLARAAGSKDAGFVTSRLSALPKGVLVVVGVWLILSALVLLGAGARALFVGRDWGKTRGTDAEKGWLGGGVGGVLFGSGAAGALSTLLALLAISRAKSTPLERWGTLAVLVGPALVGAVAGGRWARVGQVACGFFGSLSFALLLVTSFRLASVVPRLALFLVALALTAPLVLLRRTQRYALSLCAALSGAFLLVLGIDCFIHLGLVDAVGLLVSTHGVSSTAGDAAVVVVRWESAGGKGLVAGWWLVSVVSGAWQTWWGLGIDGDDTWNAYLAQFSSDNPSSPRGTHLAPLSLFSRFRQRFSQASTLTDRQARRVAPWEDLPSDGEDLDEDDRTVASKKAARRPSTRTPTRSRHAQHESDAWDSDADTLAGLGSLGGGGTSAKPAQYGPVSASAADSEDEEGGLGVAARRGGAVREQDAGPPYSSRTPARPRALARSSTSGLSGTTAAATLRSTAASTYRSVADHDGVPLADEALDLDEWDEERLAGQRLTADPTPPRSRAQGNVASRFAARLVGRGKTTPAAYAGASVGLSALDPRPASPPHAPPPHAVPATPSLMRALARVRTAQQEARGAPLVRSPVVGGGSTGGAPLSPRLDGDHVRRASMDEWWAEVVRKSEGAT